MKTLSLTVLIALLTTQLAFCKSFQVGATIPRIIGVNYFPESADVAEPGLAQDQKQVIEKIALRNGKKVIVKTCLVK